MGKAWFDEVSSFVLQVDSPILDFYMDRLFWYKHKYESEKKGGNGKAGRSVMQWKTENQQRQRLEHK